MRHRANPRFWRCYHALPAEVRQLADQAYQLLQQNPRHPSLQLKKMGRFWSARVGLHYRTLAVEHGADIVRFWIGPHAEYDRTIRGRAL